MSSKEHLLSPLGLQLARLARMLLTVEAPEPDKVWRPAAARAFAEQLILCLEDSHAAELMRRDPSGAIAFVELLGEVFRRVRIGEVVPVTERPGPRTEFYLAAALVL